MATMEETHDQAVIRLADEAAARDVRVFRAPGPSGTEWFATSRTRPGTLHRVTGYSCDCPGFARHQRCTHHSALLAYMGWLPPEGGAPAPEPAPINLCPPGHWRRRRLPVATCPDCDGEGVRRMSTGGRLDDWLSVDCRCRRAA